MPDNVEEAARLTLSPWRLQVVADSAAWPRDQASALPHARALATRHQAGAVVWLARSANGHVLWLYDASSVQLISRPLPSGPPFDEPTAAAVALSIKTLLLHSAVAPERERIAPSRQSGTPLPPRRETPDPEDSSTTTPKPSGTPLPPRSETPPPGDSSTVPPQPSLSPFALELGLVGRSTVPSGYALEPRLTAGIAWWPQAFDDRYGMAVQVEAGPGVDSEHGKFRGQFVDIALSLAARWRFFQAGKLSTLGSAGASLHMAQINGTDPSDRKSIYDFRVDPALDIGLQVHVRLGRSSAMSLAPQASATLRWQSHQYEGKPVLSSPVVDLNVGLRLIVRLP